jgi:streptogramin lyase
MRVGSSGLVALLATQTLAGCIVTMNSSGAGGEDGTAGSSASCAEGGSGTLAISVYGLPNSAEPIIAVDGPGYSDSVTGSVSLQLEGGLYTVTPSLVAAAAGDDVVRMVYAAAPQSACVADDRTSEIDVDYAAVGTSDKLWVSLGADGLAAFDGASLGASGDVSLDLSPAIGEVGGIAFDPEGGLWAVVGGDTLVYYGAEELASSGTPSPDIAIASHALNDGATSIVLDDEGNLWVSALSVGEVLKFDAADLTESGGPSPSVELSGVSEPGALTFDQDGNLWIAETGADRVLGYDASTIAASTAQADRAITARSDSATTHLSPDGMAFDDAGNLWVHYDGGVIVRLTADDRSASGEVTVTPSIQFELETAEPAPSLAFDEAGGLWLAYANGELARLSASQLVSTPDPVVPYRIVTNAGLGTGTQLALFPAPAGLPLPASLP